MGRLLGLNKRARFLYALQGLNTLADGQAPRIIMERSFEMYGHTCLNTLADGQAPRMC